MSNLYLIGTGSPLFGSPGDRNKLHLFHYTHYNIIMHYCQVYKVNELCTI